MDHALTIGDVVWPILAIGGLFIIAGGMFALLWLFNPFRSGH